MMKCFQEKLTNQGVTLTAYLLDPSPELANADVRPAVLVFPGGAYRACSDREAEPVAMAFLAEGYHAFVLRYSLNEQAEFPRPLQDAEEALELVRSRSGEWGIDPHKVAVCGFSAGGHLAGALGTMGRVRPDALIFGYPSILPSINKSIYPVSLPDIDVAVDERTPPAFIFHTHADTLVPVDNALALAAALRRCQVPFELHIFRNGTHGLSLAKAATSGGRNVMTDPDAAGWFALCIAWLKHIFGDFETADSWSREEKVEEYSVDINLGMLLKSTACQRLVFAAIPALEHSQQLQDAKQVSLRQVNEWGGQLLSPEELASLDRELRAVPVVA